VTPAPIEACRVAADQTARLSIVVSARVCLFSVPFRAWLSLAYVGNATLEHEGGKRLLPARKGKIMGILWFLLIGLVAGWLAGMVTGGGFGLLGNLVIGVVGALLGGFVFSLLGISVGSLLGSLLMATAGAIALLLVLRTVKRA
jgi:uncharacterized membrane protein YeaQ/YmgE (transglycosylase-associated protein family)